MTSRRAQLVVAAAFVLLLVVAVPLGRHERSRGYGVELGRIQAVRDLIGSKLDAPTLTAYRLAPASACLLYRSGPNYYALKLCFDPEGRLVESEDARRGYPVFGSVVFRPELARLRVPRGEIRAILLAHAVPLHEITAVGF